ncbi:MAG: hypothetical protein QF432_00845 [Dehalococcoidales bacterium]|jgi:hypothetical protein|nr:hypothetical protein [Dehalococcoidales bacterium]
MAAEQDIEELEKLVKQIEDYASGGVWETERQVEIEGLISWAEGVFKGIIDGYIEKTDVPAMQQAYRVSDLQERLHEAGHSLPFPPPRQEVGDKKTADKEVAVYTTPT